MHRSLVTWQLIKKSLEQNIPVMLLYVLESEGSSPGRQGFFMAVSAKGEMEGSIGGGIMEHKFVEMAKEKMRDAGYGIRDMGCGIRDMGCGIRDMGCGIRDGVLKKQFHDKSAPKDQSGMICSGEQTIWIYPVNLDEKKTIEGIIEILEQDRNGTLLLTNAGISFQDATPPSHFSFWMKSETEWLYSEKLGYKYQLTIIGGGHCSLAFSRLMRTMDFYIRAYDDRENLKTLEQNDAAHEKYIVGDYSELSNKVNPGNDHYVVIMTFGYRTDDIALRALMNKEFSYLGLLGSTNKIARMMEEYRKEGIDEEALQRIHAPIGLDIKSQTPEEIAVSIAAEIIREKNS